LPGEVKGAPTLRTLPVDEDCGISVEVVFLGCHDGNLYCFDAVSGRQLGSQYVGGSLFTSPVLLPPLPPTSPLEGSEKPGESANQCCPESHPLVLGANDSDPRYNGPTCMRLYALGVRYFMSVRFLRLGDV
jgi:hypothetical protein